MKALRERVGRRGAFLAFLAILDLLYGWSLVTTPIRPPYLHLILPMFAWGWVWIAVGIALIPGIFVHRDRACFALASTLKAAWAGAWVSVWLSDAFIPRAWVSVVIWGLFAGVVLVISSWPEVKTVPGDSRV